MMNTAELYEKVPVERHSEIVISGDKLFFENEEYAIAADEELKLVRSEKELKQRLARIEDRVAQLLTK